MSSVLKSFKINAPSTVPPIKMKLTMTTDYDEEATTAVSHDYERVSVIHYLADTDARIHTEHKYVVKYVSAL